MGIVAPASFKGELFVTVISVRYPKGRLSTEHRGRLAKELTDAVLEVECGLVTEAARFGFQVHFQELRTDQMAIGGVLLSERPLDALLVDIAVMDGSWPQADRDAVISNVLQSLAEELGTDVPSPSWWVNFRVIDEGSWGAGSGVIYMLDLLSPDTFTDERATAIRSALAAGERVRSPAGKSALY